MAVQLEYESVLIIGGDAEMEEKLSLGLLGEAVGASLRARGGEKQPWGSHWLSPAEVQSDVLFPEAAEEEDEEVEEGGCSSKLPTPAFLSFVMALPVACASASFRSTSESSPRFLTTTERQRFSGT
jgi:hypothetical protein